MFTLKSSDETKNIAESKLVSLSDTLLIDKAKAILTKVEALKDDDKTLNKILSFNFSDEKLSDWANKKLSEMGIYELAKKISYRSSTESTESEKIFAAYFFQIFEVIFSYKLKLGLKTKEAFKIDAEAGSIPAILKLITLLFADNLESSNDEAYEWYFVIFSTPIHVQHSSLYIDCNKRDNIIRNLLFYLINKNQFVKIMDVIQKNFPIPAELLFNVIFKYIQKFDEGIFEGDEQILIQHHMISCFENYLLPSGSLEGKLLHAEQLLYGSSALLMKQNVSAARRLLTDEKLNLQIKKIEEKPNKDQNDIDNLLDFYLPSAKVFSYSKEESDYKKHFEYIKKAAELGELHSMGSLSICYAYGRGTSVDTQQAIKWARKAYEEGNSSAGAILADYLLHFYPSNETPKQIKNRFKKVKKLLQEYINQDNANLNILNNSMGRFKTLLAIVLLRERNQDNSPNINLNYFLHHYAHSLSTARQSHDIDEKILGLLQEAVEEASHESYLPHLFLAMFNRHGIIVKQDIQKAIEYLLPTISIMPSAHSLIAEFYYQLSLGKEDIVEKRKLQLKAVAHLESSHLDDDFADFLSYKKPGLSEEKESKDSILYQPFHDIFNGNKKNALQELNNIFNTTLPKTPALLAETIHHVTAYLHSLGADFLLAVPHFTNMFSLADSLALNLKEFSLQDLQIILADMAKWRFSLTVPAWKKVIESLALAISVQLPTVACSFSNISEYLFVLCNFDFSEDDFKKFAAPFIAKLPALMEEKNITLKPCAKLFFSLAIFQANNYNIGNFSTLAILWGKIVALVKQANALDISQIYHAHQLFSQTYELIDWSFPPLLKQWFQDYENQLKCIDQGDISEFQKDISERILASYPQATEEKIAAGRRYDIKIDNTIVLCHGPTHFLFDQSGLPCKFSPRDNYATATYAAHGFLVKTICYNMWDSLKTEKERDDFIKKLLLPMHRVTHAPISIATHYAANFSPKNNPKTSSSSSLSSSSSFNSHSLSPPRKK